jgi:uncharacterized protein YndB with AHSA1/START domain
MTLPPRVQVRVSRHFDAPCDRVFNAWFDAKPAGQWLFATPTGQVTRAEFDARVGGSFVIVDRRDGQDVEHQGVYVEIARPKRLAFDFLVPQFSKESTRVTIDIAPAGSGCELTLTHDGVFEEYASRSTQGWTMILDALATTLAR